MLTVTPLADNTRTIEKYIITTQIIVQQSFVQLAVIQFSHKFSLVKKQAAFVNVSQSITGEMYIVVFNRAISKHQQRELLQSR